MSFDARHDRQSKNTNRHTSPSGVAADAVSDMSRWLGVGRVSQVRTALANAGVELTGPNIGQLIADGVRADVLLEPDDLIRVRCAAEWVEEPRRLLERCAGAVDSVRFAATTDGLHLTAESRVNGIAHLPDSLRRICAGFSRSLTGEPPDADPETCDKNLPVDTIRAAIHQAGWPQEDVVETPHGYELHTSLAGMRVTVQINMGPDSALLQRSVLAVMPEGNAGSAVAHQALAYNARLRCCRLAVSHGRLHVESRLHVSQFDGEWLSFTVRAVAAAARSVEPELQLLAHEPAVAEAYVEMFLAGPEQSKSSPPDSMQQHRSSHVAATRST